MNRRKFIGTMLAGGAAGLLLSSTSGCVAPKISRRVYEKQNGKPWRCEFCGYLTRSDKDLSEERCPRCMQKRMKPISEEELAEYLKSEGRETPPEPE